jgi:hypothetical protein
MPQLQLPVAYLSKNRFSANPYRCRKVTNRGSLTVLGNEVLMTVLMQLVSGIAITFVCVLLIVVAGCGNGPPAWRGIDSGYASRAVQSCAAEQQLNASN